MKTILELLHLESIDADLTFQEHLRLAQYKEGIADQANCPNKLAQ